MAEPVNETSSAASNPMSERFFSTQVK
jgi:hypothetical protein